ncbi:uncharacterized protein BXZ73DRAFT_11632, partial [Epithele typhae]|uniref:uncharacterized protein n=1 Tax=Epithele typhae TaxID=378194 RepID=UPI002008442B
PQWMVEAQAYLEGVSDAQWWKDLLELWKRFEHVMLTSGNQRLPTKNRPDEVKQWIKGGRQYGRPPEIKNITLFATAAKRWWCRLQPDFRCAEDFTWPLPRTVDSDSDWEDLLLGGSNGLFIAIMCLSWW